MAKSLRADLKVFEFQGCYGWGKGGCEVDGWKLKAWLNSCRDRYLELKELVISNRN
jgi:hypothetical protein